MGYQGCVYWALLTQDASLRALVLKNNNLDEAGAMALADAIGMQESTAMVYCWEAWWDSCLLLFPKEIPQNFNQILRVRPPGIEWKTGRNAKLGKNWPENKNGPRPKWGKNGPKMAKKTEKCTQIQFFTIFGPFFPHFGPWAIFYFSAKFFPKFAFRELL